MAEEGCAAGWANKSTLVVPADCMRTEYPKDVRGRLSGIHARSWIVQGMWKVARWYCQQGLMVGTIFREVLRDLRREGLEQDAQTIEGTLLPELPTKNVTEQQGDPWQGHRRALLAGYACSACFSGLL